MPRGGRRVGAGRKPKQPRAGVVLAMDGRRQDPQDLLEVAADPVLSHPPELLATPPRDLTPGQKKVWRKAAPLAIAERTLTPATVMGFRALVAQWVMTETLAARIEEAGAASDTGVDLLRSYVKLAQRLDASLARFKLTGFGKPSESAPRKPAASNPWSEVAG